MNNNYEDLIKKTRYSNLLIKQFQQNKAIQTINLYCNVITELMDISKNIIGKFELETATGKQLDFIGGLIGLERFYYNNTLITDETYRILLKFSMVNNYQLNTTDTIQRNIFEFFSEKLIMIDNRDMSLDYIFYTEDEEIIGILKENKYLLPAPAGVRIKLVIKGDEDNNFFGYSINGIRPIVLGGYSVNGEEREENGIYFNANNII